MTRSGRLGKSSALATPPAAITSRTASSAFAIDFMQCFLVTMAPNSVAALEPVDRAEEVPLPERHAAMTQDVVCRRYEEEEIRQGELLQIVVALQLPVVAAGGPGDDLALRAVDLCARQRLHEAQGGFDACLGGSEAGVVRGEIGGGSDAGEAAAGVHGEIRRLTDLAGEAE